MASRSTLPWQRRLRPAHPHPWPPRSPWHQSSSPGPPAAARPQNQASGRPELHASTERRWSTYPAVSYTTSPGFEGLRQWLRWGAKQNGTKPTGLSRRAACAASARSGWPACSDAALIPAMPSSTTRVWSSSIALLLGHSEVGVEQHRRDRAFSGLKIVSGRTSAVRPPSRSAWQRPRKHSRLVAVWFF